MDTNKSNGEVIGTAVLQLLFFPVVLAWAVVKGMIFGVLAVVTFGLIS